MVDTDKAAIEVESFHDGVVGDLLVEPGTRVQVGAPMARIGAAVGAPVEARAEVPEPAPTWVGRPEPVATLHPTPEASPPVRHHAAELGVDLADVVGTGAHGRVLRSDVDKAAAAKAAARRWQRLPPPPWDTRAGPRRRRSTPYARRLAAKLGVDLNRVALRRRSDPRRRGHRRVDRPGGRAVPPGAAAGDRGRPRAPTSPAVPPSPP